MTPQPEPSIPPQPTPRKTMVVAVVSLPAELAIAALGGFVAGLGSFVGVLTQTSANDIKSLEAAGIASGVTAITFFSNSLRNWFQQKYGALD